MTALAFVKKPFLLYALPGVPKAEPEEETTKESLLEAAVYARTKRLRSAETKPLYASGTTDYSTPAIASGIDKFYVENATEDFVAANGSFESLANRALKQPQNNSFSVSRAFTQSLDKATYFYVADFGEVPGSFYYGFLTLGTFALQMTSSKALRVIYRQSDGTTGSMSFGNQSAINGKFSLCLVFDGQQVDLYLNGDLLGPVTTTGYQISTSASGDQMSGRVANPRFYGRWTDDTQPSPTDLQALIFPEV